MISHLHIVEYESYNSGANLYMLYSKVCKFIEHAH